MNRFKLNRKEAYGQSAPHSIVDKVGGFLSYRMIRKHIHSVIPGPMTVLDLGCGYHAKMLVDLAAHILSGTGVDLAVSAQAKSIARLNFIEEPIENATHGFAENSYDIILVISVLEHLDNPAHCLAECRRILRPGGILLINVPTWKGKAFLELLAFRFRLSPIMEMDDHKMYYDDKDLWPLLVKSGFKPSAIRMTRYKLGMNLFAACQKSLEVE